MNEVTGFDELTKALEKLAKSVDKSEQEKIIKGSIKDVADRIRSNAPIGPSKNLKRSVVEKMMPRSDRFPTIGIAAIDRKIAPHAHLVEFGSAPRYQKKTGRYVGEMPPNPFIRRSWDQSKSNVLNNIENELKNAVNKAF